MRELAQTASGFGDSQTTDNPMTLHIPLKQALKQKAIKDNKLSVRTSVRGSVRPLKQNSQAEPQGVYRIRKKVSA